MKQNPLNMMPNNEWEWFKKAEKPSVYKAFRTLPTLSDKVLIRMPSNAIILHCEWLVSKE